MISRSIFVERKDSIERIERRSIKLSQYRRGGRDEVTFTIPELIGTENRASRPFQFARPPRAFNQKARAPIVGPCCPSLNCNQILPGLICDRVSRDSADLSGRIVLSIKPPTVAGGDISFGAVTKHVATDRYRHSFLVLNIH